MSKPDLSVTGPITWKFIRLVGNDFSNRLSSSSSRVLTTNCFCRGPDDNGLVVDGPGPLAKRAFENGIKNVREIVQTFRSSKRFRLSRVEEEKDRSMFGPVGTVAEPTIHVHVTVTSFPFIR